VKRWSLSAAALVLTASVALYACTVPYSPRQIAHRSLPSVVSLFIENPEGGLVLSGSGFFVAPTIVATNLHVIGPDALGFVKHPGEDLLYPIDRVVAVDSLHDLALVTVRRHTCAALPLGDPSKAVVGDEVFVVSNPRGYEGTFSQGIVSAVRREGGVDVMQISAPMSHGSSGGPVLDSAGRVIGVATALVDGEQNINFALPSSLVADLLARVNPEALAAGAPPVGLDQAAASYAEEPLALGPWVGYEP
jgi:S1-C subfamily serine protease